MPGLYDKVIIVGSDGEEADVVGGALQTSGGGGGGGGPATIADGADVNAGSTTDAVVAAGAAGTLSAKLRRVTTDLAALLARLPAALGAGGGLKVDGSGTALPVSGTVTATGPLTDAQLRATAVPVSGTVTATPTGTQAVSVADGSDVTEGAIADAVVAAGAAGTLSAKLRRLTTDLGTLLTQTDGIEASLTSIDAGTAAGLGSATGANSVPVVIASDQAAVNTKRVAATSAVTAVADTASSTTLLASNANRLGATVTNDSTAILYAKLGATASTTSYTVQIPPTGYYEVPFGYTGIIDGIWATDPNTGSARVTEITA